MDLALVRSLLKMTLKAPVILDRTIKFMLEVECLEAIEILSRRYLVLDDDLLRQMV